MFNITDTVQVLRDAETVINSSILTDDERTLMLTNLLNVLIDRTPHGAAAIGAIRRAIETSKQGRQAQGQQDAAPVASEGDEAACGSTEGQQEQAEDAGSVPSGRDGNRTTSKASAKAKK